MSGDWPYASLGGDAAAEVGQAFAARLKAVIGDLSLRDVETRTGVDHTTVDNILNGRSWPDLITIARLEVGLDTDLWPGRPGARPAAQKRSAGPRARTGR
ncbi:MAG TPA: helix-turn-helix transcriptional regulator [Acidimicrobiales bacterium]|nr:helix-turn-helix transcriptional regulator [Acidimicrobiales bacterium]